MFTHFDGRFFTAEEFDQFCTTQLKMGNWRPSFVVLHNTGAPNLAQRPHGYSSETIGYLRDFYVNTQHWHGGPHLIVDQHGVWILNDLRFPGVHSPSWNNVAWGVELLGDYESDDADAGDGAFVVANGVSALASLHRALGLDSSTIHFHREDPETTHKDCPGSNISKPAIIQRVHDKILALHAGAH